MEKKTNHILLLVEDSRLQYAALKAELKEFPWEVIHCLDMPSALQAYEKGEASGNHIGMVAMDLGLPPRHDDPQYTGLRLARELRKRDENLPILAYTSLPPNSTPFDILLAQLLPLRISLIYLRENTPNLALLLDLVYQDYVILSPGPSDHLPKAIPDRPDPLDDRLWETLALMAQGKSYSEIAVELPGVGIEGVRSRVNRIREILIEKEELAEYQRDRADLAHWHRRHHVRYHRL